MHEEMFEDVAEGVSPLPWKAIISDRGAIIEAADLTLVASLTDKNAINDALAIVVAVNAHVETNIARRDDGS